MARIPNADRAILDIRKIVDYCLNPDHPRGRHKARVFREALSIGRHDAQWLRYALLEGLFLVDAIETPSDDVGRRWRADIPVARQGRRVVIRTVWIVRSGEELPRFVTCWVL